MSRGMGRAERIREMERLYIQRGFTDIEMAERMEVDRTTAYKDRQLLESELPFVEVEPGRWKIDRLRYVSAIKVNLHEALVLYLASRRMSRQTRISQPYVASAIEKLAVTLKQPMTEQLVKAAGMVLAQTAHPERVSILEVITKGWVEQRKVRLRYRALHAGRPKNHVVSPYLIEPSLWSEGAYIIGYSEVHGGLATFKIERIEEASLSLESFTIPDSFDDTELLQHAWGIWYGDNEPMTVKLQFTKAATHRLTESIWHPKQQITSTDDGGCIWEAPIAEPQEMLPWIRGWGADVEVLEPRELRETLMGEAKAIAERYSWYVSSRPNGGSRPTLDDFFREG